MVFTVIVLLVLPAADKIRSLQKEEDVTTITAEWLAKRPELADVKIITDDPRFLFYADKEKNYLYNFITSVKMSHLNNKRNYGAMEKLARENKADVIVILAPSVKEGVIPEFTSYRGTKSIPGRKNRSIIYYSDEFMNTLDKGKRR